MRIIRSLSILCLILGLCAGMARAATTGGEVPLNMTEKDQGDTLPISLFRGRVSNQPNRYILGPGDKITIKVQDMDTYNQKLTIRPDGYATIHPFGEFYVAGTDIQGLQQWLEAKFKFYLLKPAVTVDVDELRPAILYIVGAVNKPGTYQFIREGQNNATLTSAAQEKVEITLTNILSKAGGVTEKADISHINIIHAATGEKEVLNLRDILANANGTDVWLLPGDTVEVPEMTTAMDPEIFKLVSRSTYYKGKFPVVVLGAVEKQGEVQVDPTNNSLDAALALAGGYSYKRANTSAIIVQRPGNNGTYNRWVVKRTKGQFELMPGDVLYVTDAKVASVERGFQFLSSVFQPYFLGVSGTQTLWHQLFAPSGK